MKNTHAVILLLSTALCGCHFFGPRDMTGLKSMSTDFDIFIAGNNLLLGTYAGDPDEAKALDFMKAK
jgi:hypothetical protein